ncbi:MAG: sigma-70 family RNA polymerase sigma factor [Flavobacteriaceae bacterium]
MPKNSVCQSEVFENIFNKQSKALHNYLFYKFGNKAMAEDIVQDAFIKLWQKCADVILEKAKSFLFTIATNMALNVKTHEKVVLKYQQSVQNNTEYESPEYILRQKEYMEELQKTLAALPDGQREVFLLNRIEKKTYKEIAEMLGLSVKAIEKRMHKALIYVKERIGDI